SRAAARTRRAAAAARPTPPVSATSATTTAPRLLPLKNLLLRDGDWLAPPPLVAREGDVLAGDLRRTAFRVPHGEAHVLVRGEVRAVLVPRVPFLAGGTTRRGEQHGAEQQEFASGASHGG